MSYQAPMLLAKGIPTRNVIYHLLENSSFTVLAAREDISQDGRNGQ